MSEALYRNMLRAMSLRDVLDILDMAEGGVIPGPSEIARAVGASQSAIGHRIFRMQKGGLIRKRERDKADLRRSCYSVHPLALAIMELLYPAASSPLPQEPK